MVIAGASSGIGLATALEAGARGARVVLAARNTGALQDAVARIHREGGSAIAVPTDVTNPDAVEDLAQRAIDEFGRIDTWINMAGVLALARFRDQPVEVFRRVIEINLMGQVNCAKVAIPAMERSGGGTLICIGSAFGDRGAPLWSAYSASKHAVRGWVEAIRVELWEEHSPVRVTLVHPSTINTPLFDYAKTQEGVKPRGMLPIYSPEYAARHILRAAEEYRRDVFIGAPARLAALGQRISPRLLDLVFRFIGFEGSRSREPKADIDPDNLYAPVAARARLRSSFVEHELPITRRPAAATIAAASAFMIGYALIRDRVD